MQTEKQKLWGPSGILEPENGEPLSWPAAACRPGGPASRHAVMSTKTTALPTAAAPLAVNITNATQAQARKAFEILEPFIGPLQMSCIKSLARGEEKQFFWDKACELAALVATMPETYANDGKGDQAIAYLHYFAGGQASWYITEKDKGDGSGDRGQHQAFGLADLFGDGGELGYISLPEIFAAGGEIDLHFTPATLADIRAKREGRNPPPVSPAEAAAVAEFNQAEGTTSPAQGVNLWKVYEDKYDKGDHSWTPCDEKFYDDMLNVLPPVYGPPGHGARFGNLFAVSEEWKHTAKGQGVFLWLRSLPHYACRMGTRQEIAAEVKGVK